MNRPVGYIKRSADVPSVRGKHGLIRHLLDWPYSSFHRWVRQGVYEPDWGRADDGPLPFGNLDESAME